MSTAAPENGQLKSYARASNLSHFASAKCRTLRRRYGLGRWSVIRGANASTKVHLTDDTFRSSYHCQHARCVRSPPFAFVLQSAATLGRITNGQTLRLGRRHLSHNDITIGQRTVQLVGRIAQQTSQRPRLAIVPRLPLAFAGRHAMARCVDNGWHPVARGAFWWVQIAWNLVQLMTGRVADSMLLRLRLVLQPFVQLAPVVAIRRCRLQEMHAVEEFGAFGALVGGSGEDAE